MLANLYYLHASPFCSKKVWNTVPIINYFIFTLLSHCCNCNCILSAFYVTHYKGYTTVSRTPHEVLSNSSYWNSTSPSAWTHDLWFYLINTIIINRTNTQVKLVVWILRKKISIFILHRFMLIMNNGTTHVLEQL